MIRHSKQVLELAPHMQAYFGRPVTDLSDEEIASFLVTWSHPSTLRRARAGISGAAKARILNPNAVRRSDSDLVG